MKWIIKIIDTRPYQVTCLWNDSVVRIVDLEVFLKTAANDLKNSYSQLLNKSRFSEVKCDGSTLYWENGITMKDLDGNNHPAPLDIDPDVLFEMTINTPPAKKRGKKALV